MNREKCTYCKRMMGNSLHKDRNGGYIHSHCEKELLKNFIMGIKEGVVK